jgi:hypothetical protein
MTYKAEKSEGIDRPFVPKGIYKAKFLGINDKDVPDGEFGKRLAFMYEINEGDHKGKVLNTVANARFTDNTRAGKMYKDMAGKEELEEGEEIDIESLIGKVFEVLTETLQNDFGKYSVVSEIIKEVKEGSK